MTPTMLYKCPGPHEIHGGHYDYVIVDADEDGALDTAKTDGWHSTTPEAKAANEAKIAAAKDADLKKQAEQDDTAAPTREELEQAATTLGILFDGRTKDKKLAELIAAAKGA